MSHNDLQKKYKQAVEIIQSVSHPESITSQSTVYENEIEEMRKEIEKKNKLVACMIIWMDCYIIDYEKKLKEKQHLVDEVNCNINEKENLVRSCLMKKWFLFAVCCKKYIIQIQYFYVRKVFIFSQT